MKTIQFIIVIAFAMFQLNSFSQKQSAKNVFKTDTIQVKGNCDLCKSKIEKAAKIQGVSNAVWDEKKKILVLSYDPSKVKNLDVQKKIAAVGYDTESVKASDNAYNSLPGCCKYDR